MAKLAGKRIIYIFLIAVLIAAGSFFFLPPKLVAQAQDSAYDLLVRVYNKLGEIINYLNSRSDDLSALDKKLDEILQNQQDIKKQLQIIKIRATRR